MNPPNDLNGIWDWAKQLAHLSEKRHRMREIDSQLKNISSTCGSCALWMTRRCPREQILPNGRKSGPSMNDSKCLKFEIKDWVIDHIKKLNDEREALTIEILSLVEGKQ